jgi:DNA-binding PadR family transcriptional regulator
MPQKYIVARCIERQSEEERWCMGGKNVPGERSGDPGDLLPLTSVALNVLLALADGERHGYGIMLEVRERTGGRVRLGPGTLYGAIKRLKEGGVIEESGQRPDPGEAPEDERRRYYRLSGFGCEVLAAEIERLDGLVRAARRKGAFPAPKTNPEGV